MVPASLAWLLRRLIRLDGVEAMTVDHAVDFEFDFVADLVAEESLGHRGEIADDVLVRVRIPRSEQGEALGLAGRQIGSGSVQVSQAIGSSGW